MKAWSSDNLTAADFVTTTAGDCVIDNTGDLTLEGGDTDNDNTVYLDLGTPFVDGVYSGTITFYIRQQIETADLPSNSGMGSLTRAPHLSCTVFGNAVTWTCCG